MGPGEAGFGFYNHGPVKELSKAAPEVELKGVW